VSAVVLALTPITVLEEQFRGLEKAGQGIRAVLVLKTVEGL
tara:strand:- start:124 stop:246 length:123 start_codon:yes stop_codon:yes gene_type:complete